MDRRANRTPVFHIVRSGSRVDFDGLGFLLVTKPYQEYFSISMDLTICCFRHANIDDALILRSTDAHCRMQSTIKDFRSCPNPSLLPRMRKASSPTEISKPSGLAD